MPGESTAVPARILPEIAEHNQAFWSAGADGELKIPFCPRCQTWVLPVQPECPDCDGGLEARAVSGRGTVFTYTVNGHPFNPTVPLPYVIAIVELAEDPALRLAANIVDCDPDAVSIGMPVEVRFEEQVSGENPVFVPVFAPYAVPA